MTKLAELPEDKLTAKGVQKFVPSQFSLPCGLVLRLDPSLNSVSGTPVTYGAQACSGDIATKSPPILSIIHDKQSFYYSG